MKSIRYNYDCVTVRKRRLPHWDVADGLYFATFGTADCLPDHVLHDLLTERHWSKTPEAFEYLQRYLDAGHGRCPFLNSSVASMMANTLRHFDGERYCLLAWCVMPNHVHVVFDSCPPHSLAEVIHSWKSFSAKQANKILGSNGAFWRREYFDRTIRGPVELERTIDYVVENPAQAGLTSWPWVALCERAGDPRYW